MAEKSFQNLYQNISSWGKAWRKGKEMKDTNGAKTIIGVIKVTINSYQSPWTERTEASVQNPKVQIKIFILMKSCRRTSKM